MKGAKQFFPLFVVLLFTLFSLPIFSQGNTEDPLDEEELRTMDSLEAVAMRSRFRDPSKAIGIGKKLLDKAEKLSYEEGMAKALSILGQVQLFQNDSVPAARNFAKVDSLYRSMGDPIGMGNWRLEAGRILSNKQLYRKAEEHFEEAREKFRKGEGMARLGKGHLRSARLHFFRCYYPQALQHAYKAKTLFDSIGNKAGIAQSLSRIGRIQWAQGNLKSSRKALEKAASLYEGTGDSLVLAVTYDLLGRHFTETGNNDTALSYFNKALALTEEGAAPKDRSYTRTSIAQILRERGKLDSSMTLDRRALEVFDDYEDLTGKAQAHMGMGRTFFEKGLLDSAKAHFKKALRFASKVDNHEEKVRISQLLARAHERSGDYEKAYEALQKARVYEDSLEAKEKREKAAELEARYQMRERKKELQLKEAELRKKAVQQYALLGGLGLVLLFSAFLFHQYRQKKKANEALVEKTRIIEEKNRDIFESLHYASRIQNALLPQEELLKPTFDSGFVLFKPRETVSGDLYWMEQEGGTFFMAVLDCTGHGVPGALVSMLGYDGLNKAIKDKGLKDPGEILSFLDEHLKETFKQREPKEGIAEGMDAALCSFDPKSKELRFAGALAPLYLIRNSTGEVEEYKGDRRPIGQSRSLETTSFSSRTIHTRLSDRIYIFSDGFPDQFGGERGKKLKNKAFQKMLLETGNEMDLLTQKEALERAFEDWKGDHEQVDDVLVIGARV